MIVKPGLESLYPDEVKQHKLVRHDRSFEEVITCYQAMLPTDWRIKLAICIRVMSMLLPFYEPEKLRPHKVIVFNPRNEQEKKLFIALMKRCNYSSPVTISLADRITKIRDALQKGNDIKYTKTDCR